MNLYKISQDVNNDYDTYDSAIVAAYSEEEARMIAPSGDSEWDGTADEYSDWCAASDVSVKLIGLAAHGIEKGVVLASFNAG